MTYRILDTFQICNRGFNYMTKNNPKRDLTYPCEGLSNFGFDNIDCDYILKVSDAIITPEGKE